MPRSLLIGSAWKASIDWASPAGNTSAGTTLTPFLAGEGSRAPKERFSISQSSGVLTASHSFSTERREHSPRLQGTFGSADQPSLTSEQAGGGVQEPTSTPRP